MRYNTEKIRQFSFEKTDYTVTLITTQNDLYHSVCTILRVSFAFLAT